MSGNTAIPIFISAAYTTAQQKALENQYGRGAHIIIDITDTAGTPSVVFHIEGYDSIGQKWYTILSSAAQTGTGTLVMKVYPGLTAVANQVANDVLPSKWRLRTTVADTDSMTYSASVNYVM